MRTDRYVVPSNVVISVGFEVSELLFVATCDVTTAFVEFVCPPYAERDKSNIKTTVKSNVFALVFRLLMTLNY